MIRVGARKPPPRLSIPRENGDVLILSPWLEKVMCYSLREWIKSLYRRIVPAISSFFKGVWVLIRQEGSRIRKRG